MQQEPGRRLRSSNFLGKVNTADACARCLKQEHCVQPLVKRDGRGLEHDACTDRKLPPAGVALVSIVGLEWSSAADFLRRNDPSFDEHLIAHVVKLEKEPNNFDGKAVLLTIRDERLVRIQVEFEQPAYDIVIEAFRNQKFVSLDGDIFPTGSGYKLRHTRNLTFVENDE